MCTGQPIFLDDIYLGVTIDCGKEPIFRGNVSTKNVRIFVDGKPYIPAQNNKSDANENGKPAVVQVSMEKLAQALKGSSSTTAISRLTDIPAASMLQPPPQVESKLETGSKKENLSDDTPEQAVGPDIANESESELRPRPPGGPS